MCTYYFKFDIDFENKSKNNARANNKMNKTKIVKDSPGANAYLQMDRPRKNERLN